MPFRLTTILIKKILEQVEADCKSTEQVYATSEDVLASFASESNQWVNGVLLDFGAGQGIPRCVREDCAGGRRGIGRNALPLLRDYSRRYSPRGLETSSIRSASAL